MMQVNDGSMMGERKAVERGMDTQTDSVAPMSLEHSHHHRGGSARPDTNAANNEHRLFSPRSTAAMALSSISQTFSMGSETANDSKSNETSNGSDPSQENDDRLPFLPSVSTTKTSAPLPSNHHYRGVTEAPPSSTRNHYYPHHQPPMYSSSPSFQSTGTAELYHKSDKHHAPPYSTPEASMHLERSFSMSSDPQMMARSHVKPPSYPPHPQHPPHFTPHLPPGSDGSRRVPSHFPPNDPYHPRMVPWNSAEPPTAQWMPYPHHHPPHPSLMLYPCYPMQQPTLLPHGNYGMIMPNTGGHLPPTPVQSYVTPTPHKKPKLAGEAPPSLPYHVVPPVPPPTYSSVKAPSPPEPTPVVPVKPVVEEKYNRKNKSLGVLAATFLKHFTNSGDGHEIVIDQLANDLAVERRRIYDVVNILEALQVVVKMGKNTYHWMGREHLVRQFALLQHDGILLWPDRAAKVGLYPADNASPDVAPSTEGSDEWNPDGTENGTKTLDYKDIDLGGSNKSLTRLSQMFLQVFLIGVEPVSLPQASDLIHGKASSPAELVALGMKPGDDYPSDPKTFQQIATRGLKTKIRRLYDIANVFLSIGLLRKSEYRRTACPDGKRPQYHFHYHLSLQAIREAYDKLPGYMIENQSPFSDRQLRILQVSTSHREPLNFFSQLTSSELTSFADPPSPSENTSPSSDLRHDSSSRYHRNSTDESDKIVEEVVASVVVGPVQSTPLTSIEETRATKNIQVTPLEDASPNSRDQEEPCFQAFHVLGARPNVTSPRRVSLSTSSISI